MIWKYFTIKWWKLSTAEKILEAHLDGLPPYERELTQLNMTMPDGIEKIRAMVDLKIKYQLISDYEGEKEFITRTNSGDDLSKNLLLLDVKFGRMTQEDYELACVWIKYPGALDDIKHPKYKEAKLEDLEIRHRYNSLNYFDYRRAIADASNEPFIGVKTSEFDIETGRLLIEYDWNVKFIELLRESGYSGQTDIDIVQSWMRIMNEYERMEDIGEEIPNIGGIIKPYF